MTSCSRHPPVSFSLKRHRVRARHPHPAASAKVTEHPLAPFPRPPSHGLSTSRSANYNSPRSSLSLAPPSNLLCSPPRARSLSTTTFSLNVFGCYIYIAYFCRHNPTLYKLSNVEKEHHNVSAQAHRGPHLCFLLADDLRHSLRDDVPAHTQQHRRALPVGRAHKGVDCRGRLPRHIHHPQLLHRTAHHLQEPAQAILRPRHHHRCRFRHLPVQRPTATAASLP